MFSGPNNRSPCFGQTNQHTFLNGGRNNNFNSFTMPPQSQHQQSRRFQSCPSSHWIGKGNRLNGKPAPSHNFYNPPSPPSKPPQSQGSIFSGVRDVMSRFLPHNNFSSKFSQKNKDIRDYPVIIPSLPLHTTPPQTNFHTIITVTSPTMSVDAVLFSAEDFPALSKPKPVPSVKELWELESKKREKKTSTCNNSRRRTCQNKKDPASKDNSTCDLENDSGFLLIDFDCTKLHFISFSPPKHATSSTVATPCAQVPRRSRMRQRQISECSDDSFVVCFTDDIDDLEDSDSEDDDDDDESSETEGPDDSDDDSSLDGDVVDVDEVDGEIIKKTDRFAALAVCDNSNQLDSGFEEPVCKKRVSVSLYFK